MKTNILNSNLSARAANALTRGGFVYFEDLAQYSRNDLLKLRNMTEDAMRAIDAELLRLSIVLSDVDRGLPEVHSTLKDKTCFAESFDAETETALKNSNLPDLDALRAFLASCASAEAQAEKLQQVLHLTPDQSQAILDALSTLSAFEADDEIRSPIVH